MRYFKFILLLFFIFLLCSCGADKLKGPTSTSQSRLDYANQQCQCTSSGAPVCGSDNRDYDNSCINQCFGVTVKNIGHCNCAANQILVCGKDGNDYTECEAKNLGIEIVKFTPCAAKEM
jgi:hypothetical protein